MREVAITGVGAVTALGDLDATFAALLEGRSGIGGPGPFPGKGPVAAIEGGPHLTSALALRAARDALGDSQPPRMGVVGGSTSGDMIVGEQEYEAWFRGGPTGPRFLWSQLCDRPAEILARTLGATGPRLTLSTACASGASAVGVGADWVRSGRCDAVLAFGADALCQLTVHGFGSLQAMSPEGCRPFDLARTGLSLGEGAGALLLEDLQSARRRGATVLALVTGYGTAADAWHATAPHPEGRGARDAIRAALGDLPPERVGYVNAHGTGTKHNDEMEGAVLAEELPAAAVSSIKGAIGHTLGAAGAIELAVTVKALVEGVLPPNVGVRDPAVPVLQEPVRRHVEHAISVNFAFGGTNAAVRLTSVHV
ncbi:MAG: beta-ketoacyl-[acyl-carrier-protein] synthase family protein [Alphaproteobacteria bacterium]|nr:beta-ketoacyl-[acyl-carrier-protein] synthase family protein [Alphaproteobacteria bacterium]